ncbi:MAG: Coenzyme F420 hydrogenase/dehydrogenase, beta subunit C-terminal domain [candidate division KSB1 bacterium]|nr:Coenzyme F420 hydrogenase/dehydrogenase, beta subunit C-terminal domain [candidate division KSB1 bacterium]MDZ7345335.1 Coenzyme F420 hydrogenase/dehydrogenase, beta subunit C-terminal domain [candidate division KSB1 bacterium]
MRKIDPAILSISFTDHRLCTRCGTCVGVCPVDALFLDENFFPRLDADKCIACGLCRLVCPGGEVRYKELETFVFGSQAPERTFDGHVRKTFIGFAGDPAIRAGGAGGGVVTALASHLLRSGKVDACIVTRMNPEKPWLGQVFIARTLEDLRLSQQSKYTIIPVNAILQVTRKSKERFALVALPCQIHGIRLIQEKRPQLIANIKYIIGLFCASSLEPYVAEELLAAKGIDKRQIKTFHFRGGRWPGRIRAVMKDGGIKNLHYSNFKDGAINYLMYLYTPPRCAVCIDGSSEFSDVSVSDAWTRDRRGNYLYEAQSRLLVRTPAGIEMVESALAAGDLIAREVSQDPQYRTHRLHARKKGLTAYLRVERLKCLGEPVPIYDRGTPEHDRTDRLTERIESFLMRFGRIRRLRQPLIKALLSRYGAFLIILRQYRKKRKYR